MRDHRRTGRLIDELDRAGQGDLVALARRGRRAGSVPAFSGRCLDPDFLSAVASGSWTREHETALIDLRERTSARVLPRVAWWHRRGLRTAVQAACLLVVTTEVAAPTWQRRRSQLARVCGDALTQVCEQSARTSGAVAAP